MHHMLPTTVAQLRQRWLCFPIRYIAWHCSHSLQHNNPSHKLLANSRLRCLPSHRNRPLMLALPLHHNHKNTKKITIILPGLVCHVPANHITVQYSQHFRHLVQECSWLILIPTGIHNHQHQQRHIINAEQLQSQSKHTLVHAGCGCYRVCGGDANDWLFVCKG